MRLAGAAVSLCIATVFAGVIPTRCWGLEPLAKPSPEALRQLDKERARAYRAERLKLRLTLKSIGANRRGDEKRAQAIDRLIDEIDANGRPEDRLTEVLNKTRRLYHIEPSPGALYEGKPYEWRTEYDSISAMGNAIVRARYGGAETVNAAQTSVEDGSTAFVDLWAFESLPRLAAILVHEAVHFEQFTTVFLSSTAIVDPREAEAQAVQAEYRPALGLSKVETAANRSIAENLGAAMDAESLQEFSKILRYEAGSMRRRPPIRHRNEIIRLINEWADSESKSQRKSRSEYWGRFLRNERTWRFLRATVARLCAAPSGDLKGIRTLKTYEVERPFAAASYSEGMHEYSDCEQDALADFVVAPQPIRYEDLMGFVRAYRMRHGPWKDRLAAFKDELYSRGRMPLPAE